MKKTKKTIILLLAFLLAVSMSISCKNKGGGSTILGELPDYGYFHKYADTVKLSVGQLNDKPNSYFGDQRIGSNDVYSLWSEIMNVDFEVAFTGGSNDISTQVKYQMYDNDLPDITPCSEVMFGELYEQEMIRDLTPYYEKYASAHLKQILEYNTMQSDLLNGKTEEEKAALKQKNILASSYKNNKLFAIPMLIDKYSFTPYMYIRSDWLKALAKKDFNDETKYLSLMPKTSTEVISLAYRFKNEIPNLIGYTKSVYPMYTNDMNYLYQMFGATNSYYEQDEAGNWTYSTHKSEMRDALNSVRQLVVDNILDSRIFTEQSNAVSVVKNGGCGIYVGYFWQPMQDILDTVKLVSGSDWEVSLMYDEKGEYVKPYSRPNLTLYYVVSEKCKHPEALFIMLNHIVEGAFDPEALYSSRLANLMLSEKFSESSGNLWEWSPVVFDVPDKNYYSSLEVLDAIENNKGKDSLKMSSSLFVYDRIKGYMDNPDPIKNNYDWVYYKIYKEVVPLTIQYNNRINYGGFFGTATEQMLAKAVAISDYQSTEMIKLQTQKTEITTEQFSNFVTKHRSTGIKDVLDELDRYYKDTWRK